MASMDLPSYLLLLACFSWLAGTGVGAASSNKYGRQLLFFLVIAMGKKTLIQ